MTGRLGKELKLTWLMGWCHQVVDFFKIYFPILHGLSKGLFNVWWGCESPPTSSLKGMVLECHGVLLLKAKVMKLHCISNLTPLFLHKKRTAQPKTPTLYSSPTSICFGKLTTQPPPFPLVEKNRHHFISWSCPPCVRPCHRALPWPWMLAPHGAASTAHRRRRRVRRVRRVQWPPARRWRRRGRLDKRCWRRWGGKGVAIDSQPNGD